MQPFAWLMSMGTLRPDRYVKTQFHTRRTWKTLATVPYLSLHARRKLCNRHRSGRWTCTASEKINPISLKKMTRLDSRNRKTDYPVYRGSLRRKKQGEETGFGSACTTFHPNVYAYELSQTRYNSTWVTAYTVHLLMPRQQNEICRCKNREVGRPWNRRV